jgi:small GTP-binding protein
MMESIKLVTVGDNCVGKVKLLISYVSGDDKNRCNRPQHENYTPSVFDNCALELRAGEKRLEFCLWDTSGQEDYERLRLLSYREADVFLLCFSVVKPSSYANALEKVRIT